jgi:hypothetical protein
MPQKSDIYKVFTVSAAYQCPPFFGDTTINVNATSAAVPVVLPSAQGVEAGTPLEIVKVDSSSNHVTVSTTSTAGVTTNAVQTILTSSGLVTSLTLASQGSRCRVVSDGLNWMQTA